MKKYVVVDIGCIECGEQTSVLGIFTDKNKARQVLEKCKNYQENNWTGEHEFIMFEIDKEDELIDKWYKKRIMEEIK